MRIILEGKKLFTVLQCVLIMGSGFCAWLPNSVSWANDGNDDIAVIDTRSLLQELMSTRPMVSPGSSIASPVAYGANLGTVFFGVTGQDTNQNSRGGFFSDPFGQYAVGFGLGNSKKCVGLTTTVTTGGLDDVIRDGNVNFLVFREITQKVTVGVGVENVGPWGGQKRNNMNAYAVGSTLFGIQITPDYLLNIITSVGFGNSRFFHNFQTTDDDFHKIGPFGSVGVQVLPQAAIIVDYVGQTLNTGISVAPIRSFPFVMGITATNLTGRGGTNRIPLAGTLGISWNFL